MPADSFTYALERLDPASRALLDLSLRRGMRTEEIAEVLGAEPESVEASRDDALERIAGDVGIGELDEVRAKLAELPADQWLGRTNGVAVAEKPDEPEQKDEPKRGRRLWPLILGLLVTAGVIVAIALATSSSDDTSSSTPTTSNRSTPPAATPPPATGAAAKLAPVGAANASGTALVKGNTLRLQASGLPAGHYEVWLYNSILDARPIGTADGSRFTVTGQLPAGWKRFRYVDVSREPQDGNVSHSGESVLRVPTKTLLRR
jgi:hypothetical protein